MLGFRQVPLSIKRAVFTIWRADRREISHVAFVESLLSVGLYGDNRHFDKPDRGSAARDVDR
jgi:hypothetical protein